MNLKMGSQTFLNVQIPLLWGTRAVLQSGDGEISIIDLSGEDARLEIVANEPAPGIDFKPNHDGISIIVDGEEAYRFDASRGLMESSTLNLPPCQVSGSETIVGTNRFSGNVIRGFGVGLKITEDGMAMGAPLPEGLASLVF